MQSGCPAIPLAWLRARAQGQPRDAREQLRDAKTSGESFINGVGAVLRTESLKESGDTLLKL